jgi:hypothetical protein
VKYVFDAQRQRQVKVVLFHLLRINVKATGELINIPVEDFHMVKTAP